MGSNRKPLMIPESRRDETGIVENARCNPSPRLPNKRNRKMLSKQPFLVFTPPSLQQPQHRQILIQILPKNPLPSGNQAPVVQFFRRSLSESPVPVIGDAQFAAIFQQDIKALCGNAHLGCFDGFVFRWRGHIFFLRLFCFSCKTRVLSNKINPLRVPNSR